MQRQEEQPSSREGRDLLVLLLRTATPGGVIRRAWSNAAPAAREHAIATATEHRVLGVLGARATAAELKLPPDLATTIERVRRHSVGRHLLARRTVSVLRQVLPVRHAVFKGPILSELHHRDAGSRVYSDLDVLVDRHSFGRAVECLTDAGFAPLATNWDGFREYGVAEVPFGHRGGLLDVDLHFHTVGLARDRTSLRIDSGRLLDRSMETTVGEDPVRTFDPIDTLLHLCVNAGLEGARGLRALLDIDAVMQGSAPDVAAVVRRAEATGVATLAASVLQRCAMVLGTEGAAMLADHLPTPPGWLAANQLADGARRRGARRGLLPGWLLAAGRPQLTQTARALLRTARAELVRLRGRPGLTQPGGALDWKTGDASAASVAAYLTWVAGPRGMAVEEVATSGACHDLLGHLQPRATPLLSAAANPMTARARIRRRLVRDDDGAVLAVVVTQRVAVGVMPAFVVLIDPRAAEQLGGLLDRGGATTIAGFEQDLEPLRDVGRRWLHEDRSKAAALPAGFSWEAPSVPTRVATVSDVDALMALRRKSTPGRLPSSRRLQPVMTAIVEDRALILDDEHGGPIGYIARQGHTAEWDLWGHLEILPSHRGQGHSWRLLAAAAQTTRDRGVGGMVLVASTNPMPLPDDTPLSESWIVATPTPPRRFKGEPRLRRLLQRTREAGPRVPHYRTSGPDDHLITTRRTQRSLRETAD
ncbi:nucleotidyltransferase family protein [Euzebya tangerina]|uniref:nucleotidyltransferase family protein n=1 Tax=Euzebya tangerina TaxID=591198 RepID=UPI000E31F5D4|nr:nucleotidyltransferase family protein [Euzebya tangerina]